MSFSSSESTPEPFVVTETSVVYCRTEQEELGRLYAIRCNFPLKFDDTLPWFVLRVVNDDASVHEVVFSETHNPS